jgi:predicted nuclease with TOPRIM domain
MLDTLASVAARNSGDISDLRGVVENFALQLNVFVEEGRAFRDRMSIMQSEIVDIRTDIRGLQTENRRILEQLENNNNP